MAYSFTKDQWEAIFKVGYPGTWDIGTLAAEAMYRGGEALVKKQLKDGQYLPYNLEDIIEEGLKKLSEDMIDLKTPEEVQDLITEALNAKKGLSVIRLGDGEVLALSHDILVSSDEINKNEKLKYALGGFSVPNHEQRDLLIQNLLEADIVGIPEARYPTYQRLFNNVANAIKLPLKDTCFTSSQINYKMNESTACFHYLLSHYRVLLIGNRAKDGKDFLNNKGYNSIVGTIPVPGIASVPEVLEQAQKYDFDVAFVSAGIPANLICVELAKQKKIALDFGHLLDWYIKEYRILRKG
ncbi:GT-D fold domain-containing glycosyltransferase [Peribacillus alkalitolerans]|uniref:GT-D fold domain-containing protein n=1 Tax=Peribacillus alkalitolerans TaxID=1550385 RepID=UPI0013D495BB|nr:GT-D fold domain-containing glycosyltransferase [Peribacillus alkalitolerans]